MGKSFSEHYKSSGWERLWVYGVFLNWGGATPLCDSLSEEELLQEPYYRGSRNPGLDAGTSVMVRGVVEGPVSKLRSFVQTYKVKAITTPRTGEEFFLRVAWVVLGAAHPPAAHPTV